MRIQRVVFSTNTRSRDHAPVTTRRPRRGDRRGAGVDKRSRFTLGRPGEAQFGVRTPEGRSVVVSEERGEKKNADVADPDEKSRDSKKPEINSRKRSCGKTGNYAATPCTFNPVWIGLRGNNRLDWRMQFHPKPE